jgi:DNA-binding transcriptional LysR family regulator
MYNEHKVSQNLSGVKMDITQLKYLAAIVENNFNISQAARQLYISQPALSKAITMLEKEANLQIFERLKGRLIELTTDGQLIFEHAKLIINHYDELMSLLEMRSRMGEGDVLLGIPPLVITALFSDFLSLVREKNPKMNVTVVENGGKSLEEMVTSGKLDFCVMVSPESFRNNKFIEIPLHKSEYAIFVAENHPLIDKQRISWNDLNNEDIALCDESFKTYHLFIDYIQSHNIIPHSLLTAYSWDYLFASIRKSNKITFLPDASQNIFNMNGVKMLRFENPMPWSISFVYRKKSNYTTAEKYLIDFIRSYFKK